MDDCIGQPNARPAALPVVVQKRRQGQPVPVREERAEVFAQVGRQHRDRDAGEVDACPAEPGLRVQGVPFGRVAADVGDVDAETAHAARQDLQGDRVVEILRRLAVDRDDQKVPQVLALAGLRRIRLVE